MTPAKQRARRLRGAREREAVHENLAGSGHVDATDQVEERRLAGAAPPDEHAQLTAVDRGVHPTQDHPLGVTLAVRLRDAV